MELAAELKESLSSPSGEETDPQNNNAASAASQVNIKQHHFHHSQLPGDRYIRLLRIIQGDSESVSVTLHTFPLEQLPEYEALSYTWGKAIRTDDKDYDDNGPRIYYTILVNSEPSTVIENLYNGLSELKKDITGYLWVDALCIDQMNVNERASYVLLMRDIYSSAKRAIVWLGEATDIIEDVIWLLERYLPVVEQARFPVEEVNFDLLNCLGITTDRWFELWEIYDRFFSYRWFSRAWVVQEYFPWL
jgi:hypothetical protein